QRYLYRLQQDPMLPTGETENAKAIQAHHCVDEVDGPDDPACRLEIRAIRMLAQAAPRTFVGSPAPLQVQAGRPLAAPGPRAQGLDLAHTATSSETASFLVASCSGASTFTFSSTWRQQVSEAIL